MIHSTDYLIAFKESVDTITLPEKFPFPFYYQPHPLAVLAVKELQATFQENAGWDENFGAFSNKQDQTFGKMFGVLVVRNQQNELHYLAAFSGKLDDAYPIQFVPPVFDLWEENSFYRLGEKEINAINSQIEVLQNAPEFNRLKSELEVVLRRSQAEIIACKTAIKVEKIKRQALRSKLLTNPSDDDSILLTSLGQASIREQYFLKDLTKQWKEKINASKHQLDAYEIQIRELKNLRKQQSAQLQQQLFEHFSFLNYSGETKNLLDLFVKSPNEQPPSGAGDCAAPKLLQYAYINQLVPIAMAEFWWGKSPLSEVRKHGQFYPACRSKCLPILNHMLLGLEVEENPFLMQAGDGKELDIVYEDDAILIVNKPAEFLSVPGIELNDSIYTRVLQLYPNATGPLIVHRLDMSTSGLLVIAKTKEAHAHLQRQFLKRKVKKRYVAVLDGIITEQSGSIELPLRVDLEDRPRQLICFDHGKPATTKWEVISRTETTTRIQFYPITGRTHQLRVHAAHKLGLNTPIVGDDLYGKKSNRLHLHAEWLSFIHPTEQRVLTFKIAPNF